MVDTSALGANSISKIFCGGTSYGMALTTSGQLYHWTSTDSYMSTHDVNRTPKLVSYVPSNIQSSISDISISYDANVYILTTSGAVYSAGTGNSKFYKTFFRFYTNSNQ